MEPSQFDELTKALATPTSRRQALRTFVATTLGGILGLAGIGTAFAKPKCHRAGLGCDTNSNCCSGLYCANGKCTTCPALPACNSGCPCPSGQVCQSGQCVTPCVANGGQCTSGQDCCSGRCDSFSGTCVSCIPNEDFFCHADSDCCSGLCETYSGICGCGIAGSDCLRNEDCCSNTCTTPGFCA